MTEQEYIIDDGTEADSDTSEVVEVRPFLDTPFTDYTVTEGLLLSVLLVLVLSACIRVVKEGFSWL